MCLDQKKCDGSKSFVQGFYADLCFNGDDGYYSKYFFTQGCLYDYNNIFSYFLLKDTIYCYSMNII